MPPCGHSGDLGFRLAFPAYAYGPEEARRLLGEHTQLEPSDGHTEAGVGQAEVFGPRLHLP